MKKRIAVFASGWGDEYFREVVYGLSEEAKKENMDVFVFVNFSIRVANTATNIGEFNIFTLPDLNDFDGIVLLANSFNLTKELEYFKEKIKNSTIPVISVEYELENEVSLVSDNYAGMLDLVRHVVKEHGARDIVYIGGPEEHLENVDRLKALRTVAEEYGFSVPDSNIKYGDWAKKSALHLTKEWVQENGRVPDAFLCGNDIMAMGVCEQLSNMNYEVPKDVLVTGYDCLRAGQNYQPKIASVGHKWEEMGATAVQMMKGLMEGKEEKSRMLPTCFVPAKSCGCVGNDLQSELIQSARKSHGFEIDGIDADSHFRHIYLAVNKAEDAQGVSDGLNYLLAGENQMEGKNFMLCLDPEFFRIEEDDLNLYEEGYSEKVHVVGFIRDEKAQPHVVMNTKDAMFFMANESETSGTYIFAPVFNESKTYGFAILTGDLRIACKNQLYIWTRHVNQDLEQVRRNIKIADLTRKLTQLSVTDVLTGVYNRAGCEEIAYPLLLDWRDCGGTGVVMLVDIDKMKMINDLHGHANGDLALRTVATVLKGCLPEEWIISRFGGDEFFVGGRLQDSEIDLTALRNTLEASLAAEVKKRGIEFRLTISVGSTLVQPGDTLEIEKYLQVADKDMYEIKRAHHEEIENEQ
ncbi:MAG: GGDEF domain-containing protein [Lachnospiraceae bacterium]|nr:GGDEF domain-containing protein [Lachnospiraceae bacterium]